MRPIYLRHFVFVEETVDDVGAEHIASTPGAHGEARVVGVGVAPHQIRKRPFMRDLLEPLYLLYVLYVLDGGRETGVHAEDGVVDYGSYWQEIEQVSEVLPHCWRPELSLTLCVEAINLRDLPCFMVSS